jgi:hypothetical protein
MDNVITYKTQTIPVAADQKRSTINVPVNEDWSMVVEILSVSGGIVQGKKVWDTATVPKTFYAKLLFNGHGGTPQDEIFTSGRTIFHRVGNFNSQGTSQPELTTENSNNFSWVCFAENPLVQVEDLDGSTGKEVYFDSSGNKQTPPGSETLSLVANDTSSSYYNGNPPFQTGRIYWGQKIFGNPNYYLVFLPGFGDEEKTFSDTAGGVTFTIKIDGSGKVLDFTAV